MYNFGFLTSKYILAQFYPKINVILTATRQVTIEKLTM